MNMAKSRVSAPWKCWRAQQLRHVLHVFRKVQKGDLMVVWPWFNNEYFMGFTIQTHIRSHSSGKSPCLIGKSSVGSIAMLDHQRENLLVSPQLSAPMAWHTADIIQATHQQIQHLIPQSCDAGGQATATFGPSQSWWKIYGEPRFLTLKLRGVVDCKCSLPNGFLWKIGSFSWHFIVMSPWKTHLVRYCFLTNPNLRSNNRISFLILSYKRNGCCTEECSRDIPTEDV